MLWEAGDATSQSGVKAAEAPGAPVGDDAACGAGRPPAAERSRALSRPTLSLPKRTDFEATIYTSCGDMKIDLLEREAPKTVANFVFLARSGFYDGLIWHQVLPNALIQTGDPNGYNGVTPDGPGYTIPDELPANSSGYTYGAVGMANTGQPHSGGSQFFVVTHGYKHMIKGETPQLKIEPTYAIFGRVKERFFGSVENIARQPLVGGSDPLLSVRPSVPIYIESIRITQSKASRS